MSKLPAKISELDIDIKSLTKEKGFVQAQNVINKVSSLLGIESGNTWKLFNDSQGKIRQNAGWFKEADGFADRRASYKIAEGNAQNLDLKAFWMKKARKSVISWLVALTPNFEDEPFYGNLNVGIDFVIPEKADRVIVILSKNYVIRTLELTGELSVTQQDIFAKWLSDFDFTNKAQIHEALWQSFDIEPLNKRFYKEISSFFVELKGYLTKESIFDDKHASYFVNRLIGRVVFCWFLEKKNIINPEIGYFDTEEQKADEFYRTKLETLFFKVFNTPIEDRDLGIDDKTPFLNGGLFDPKDGDKFGDLSLTFPADYFDRFFKFLKHYNFTTDESTSTFQQVAIDPEMLGRIFENLLAEQVSETGEQARKAKGAFYTPREIVDYMCRESLREYLKGQLGTEGKSYEVIDKLLDSKEHDWRDQQTNYRRDLKPYKYDILKALDNMTIIDPACGSGAFPMGMLSLLLESYERLESTFDPYKKKLNIIKNNLFGVDIEPMAVEISRLRAWLSIVVDEENIEPLPNLDFKFVCANSLLPLKKDEGLFDKQGLKEEMQEVRDKYYNARTKKSKENLKRKFEKLIEGGQQNMFASDKENQLKSYHPFDEEVVADFFDPEFMFGVEGFDVVIGNPPYFVYEGANNKDELSKIKTIKLYDQAKSGKLNAYKLFLLRSSDITSKDGIVCEIFQNSFLADNSAKGIRNFFLNNQKIIFIDSFPERDNANKRVFYGVKMSVCILLSKNSREEEYNFVLNVWESKDKINGFKTVFSNNSIKTFDPNGYSIPSIQERERELFNNLFSKKYDRLRDVCKKCYRGELNMTTERKYFTAIPNKFLALKGAQIQKYFHTMNPSQGSIEFVNRENYIEEKNGEKVKHHNAERIVMQRITGVDEKFRIKATIVKSGKFCADSCNYISSSDLKKISINVLLGILNSTIFNWIFKKTSTNSNVNSYEVENIPIPNTESSNLQIFVTQIESLVDQILTAKKDNPKTDTSELEAKIDELVFDLYELTEEERGVVLNS